VTSLHGLTPSAHDMGREYRVVAALAGSPVPVVPAVTMRDDDPTVVRAVLDWEMSTLGDPLSDAALMCVHRDPALNLILNEEMAWTAPQMPSAEELAHRYAVVSGHPLVHWDFQMARGYFKLAIIAAGIDFRRRMASERPDGDDRAGQAVAILSRGLQTLG
jgi:aminoglycoside phosphotransferase (APT) family kinase protein